jgi:hypothetical protein
MRHKKIWKEIVGYEGRYLISNYAEVKSVKRTVKHSRPGLTRTVPEKMLSYWRNHRGYVMVSVHKGGKRSFAVHILVAKHFVPNPDSKPEVNHKRGNKEDNRAWMLEWNTRKENNDHSRNVLGKKFYGEKHGMARLTESDVRRIIELYKTGKYTYVAIAKMFEMEETQIHRIVKRTSWIHLKIA